MSDYKVKADAWDETNLLAELAAVKSERDAVIAIIADALDIAEQAEVTDGFARKWVARVLADSTGRAVKDIEADAWDEGFYVRADPTGTYPPNPYRTEAT